MIVAQDQAALIRSTAAQILRTANTIAGDRVEEERVDGIADGDSPRLIVYADQTAQTDSPAGTAATFVVTLKLAIQALAEDAVKAAVVAKLDTLIAQTKAALFCAPAFTLLNQNIASFQVVSMLKSGGAYITGDARLLITATWRETYNPVETTPFDGLNVTTEIGHAPTVVSQFNP